MTILQIQVASAMAWLLAFVGAGLFNAIGDAVTVLRSGGSKTVALGIHGVTALVIIAAGASLIFATN